VELRVFHVETLKQTYLVGREQETDVSVDRRPGEGSVRPARPTSELGRGLEAGDLDPPVYSFDVSTSLHDDVKEGRIVRVWSRVNVSREAFPSYGAAAEAAACIAMCVHGGMATAILPRY
jgi:hypothetical protein